MRYHVPMAVAGKRKRKRWILQHADSTADAHAIELARSLGVHPLVATLISQRNMSDQQAAERFWRPNLAELADPCEIAGVDHAANIIADAIKASRPIVVYGDYDVDGVTASSVMWYVLRQLDANVSVYIPHRLEEGYGLNCDAIASLCDRPDGQNPVIVSVDCGITATESARTARKLGATLIICDHHQFDANDLPEADAIVHPGLDADKQPTDSPLVDLCGAAVAMKLAWHTARVVCGSDRLPETVRLLLIDLMSLVALGTIADVVPLVGENRTMTMFGLSRIKQTRFIGLNAMIDAARLRDEKIDSYHVGFVLGPRLNACGRMGHAGKAVHLLTQADADEARHVAQFLTTENTRRQRTERKIVEQARAMIGELGYDTDDHRAIVVVGDGWHPGVVGVVASRLVDRYHRPAIVLAGDNGTASGSGRSVDQVNLHAALASCSDHLTKWGGHAMAAGLTLDRKRVDGFREDFTAAVAEQLPADDMRGRVKIDAAVTLDQCEIRLFEQVQRLAPFGRGNPKPTLMVPSVRLSQPMRRMGQGGKHASLMLADEAGAIRRAVAFNVERVEDDLTPGVMLDVAFEPTVSTWQGRRRAEIHVRDVRPAQGDARDAAG